MQRLLSTAVLSLMAALVLAPAASASDGVATVEMSPCHTAAYHNYCVRVIHLHALPWTLEIVWTFCEPTGCNEVGSQRTLWPAGVETFEVGGGDNLFGICVLVHDDNGNLAAGKCS